MRASPDLRAVGSPRSLAPVSGIDVGLPLSPSRAAAARHSQEATQPAPNSPASMQQDTPPRLSQRPTQPMEFTLTPTKDKGTSGKTPPIFSQETTQPATSQLVDLFTHYRERLDNEEEQINECLAQYQQTGKGQSTASSTDNQTVLVSVASAQYQQTGEWRMAHVVDTAQPTHLISRIEDADMQLSPDAPRSDAHITTPRRSIGGRCRKWVVSTQDSSSTNKRACTACTICSKQFTPGEPRLQQWSNRDTQLAYVHAECMKGGLKTSHEFVPKNPKDTDAKEAVLCLRNSVLHAATEAGVVLPIYDPNEDNSRVGPDDEDRTFDREEDLRLDDAIMDFNWFSSVSWTDIKDLRGTTYVQPLSCTTVPPHPILNQLGRSSFSAAGSSQVDQLKTRPTPTAQATWRQVWTSFGQKSGPPCGQWSEPNAMWPQQHRNARRQRQNKPKPGSAKWPLSLELGRKDEH